MSNPLLLRFVRKGRHLRVQRVLTVETAKIAEGAEIADRVTIIFERKDGSLDKIVVEGVKR